MGSRRYLLRKVLHAIATLIFVLAFNFVLFRAVGDPVKLLTRTPLRLDPKEQAALREEFGLGRPVPGQFVNYLGDTLQRASWALSFQSGRPVITGDRRADPTDACCSSACRPSSRRWSGILVGIKGAWRRGSAFDTGASSARSSCTRCPRGGSA